MRERRRFIRFKVPLDLEMSVPGDDNLLLTGQSLDFSRQGIRCILPSPAFDHKQPIRFKAYLPKRLVPILFEGSMRWVCSKDDRCELGVKINRMDADDKNDILEHAYNLWRKENNGS